MLIFKLFLIFITLTIAHCVSYTVTSKIYIDVKHQKKPVGRIVFGLFGKTAPKTVANFRHICLRGINGSTYVGSEIHRIVNRFLIQGGDVVNSDGTGSISIYGEFFNDEPEALKIKHNRAGFLGMANRGVNTNGCQFYISTVTAEWLDGKHAVFGLVLEGMHTVSAIEDIKTDSDNYPLHSVVISNCGEMPTEPFEFYPDEISIMDWIKGAGLPIISSFILLFVFHYFFRQLNAYC